MIRRDGELPVDAPNFAATLDEDLLGYGYGLLSTSLRMIEDDDNDASESDNEDLLRQGFIHASYAIEAATRNASVTDDLAFHRLIAGAASHLAGYGARAYSLVQASLESGRLTPMELTLADLITRDLDGIEQLAQSLRSSSSVSDETLLIELLDPDSTAAEDIDRDEWSEMLGPVGLLLTENYVAAVSQSLFALADGLPQALAAALEDLAEGQEASQDIRVPGPWWVYRLTRRLVQDLDHSSIRTNIPKTTPPAARADPPSAPTTTQRRRWRYLRRTFVASLFARGRSEIDLWPSQLHVVERIFGSTQDLVVALPTSAGKTRIAELCILACLAQDRRVVYVTPLRALSAQTEHILDRTFAALGVRVSSLYGSMGVSHVDDDALRTSQIVVATPEKLDFALRSDASVLDDVGLVVLDEGHMIGPSEREVRYEAQIQRLLRRPDAPSRRIVCLSAVFPSGQDLDDFVAWVTDDTSDGLHREEWRPTHQRFGLVEWRGDHARLTMTLGQDQPFIPRFLEAKKPRKPRRNPFPNDSRELVIATAWTLVQEGQTVLIFCPQRNSVEPYAREVIRLHRQGLIESVLADHVDIADALAVGAEWFGDDHPILQCLSLGVAIHHGALPGPFRREVERLLHEGAIRVTVASPTLAQGLNLSASVVLFHGLRRGQTPLTGAEFSNVIGRAGRAFVDTEGLVLYPVFEPAEWRRREWMRLTTGDAGKALRSGMITVGIALILRIIESTGSDHLEPLLDYLTGGADWALPVVPAESDQDRLDADQSWNGNLALLDTAILSVVGDVDCDPDEITQVMIDGLRDSLFDRQLKRLGEDSAEALHEVVARRAQHIWSTSTPSQRRGWYLAGLGANAGVELAGVSSEVIDLTAAAELAIAEGNLRSATGRLQEVAQILFATQTFQPETRLSNWPEILEDWVNGRPLGDRDVERTQDRVAVAQFVEADLIYRLVWGMEACCVYESAQGNQEADVLLGTALTAIETGTFNVAAATLIRSGFDHRSAAISAVEQTSATFESTSDMRTWIRELDPALSDSPDWPTAESHDAWATFVNRAGRRRVRQWRRRTLRIDDVMWFGDAPPAGTWLRLTDAGPQQVHIWTAGFERLGQATVPFGAIPEGVMAARRSPSGVGIEVHYRGPQALAVSSRGN
ncbi:MAG: DEAD/DEAH box helicase [Tetrasphaera sp.]